MERDIVKRKRSSSLEKLDRRTLRRHTLTHYTIKLKPKNWHKGQFTWYDSSPIGSELIS